MLRPIALFSFAVTLCFARTLATPDELHADEPEAPPACPAGMVYVPKANVSLGVADDPDALAPATRTLGPFCVDRTEVTVAQYRECVASKRCRAPETTVLFPGYGPPEPMRSELSQFCNAGRSDRSDHPMNCVDQPAAAAYCASKGGRLPDEQEWEYVARGPSAHRYPWGAEPPKGESAPLCWDRRDAGRGTCAVGAFAAGASPSGALDMAGNVWEWTATSSSDSRIVRGGGWTNFMPRFVRTTTRWSITPTTRLNCIGFRCVQPAPAVGSRLSPSQ